MFPQVWKTLNNFSSIIIVEAPKPSLVSQRGCCFPSFSSPSLPLCLAVFSDCTPSLSFGGVQMLVLSFFREMKWGSSLLSLHRFRRGAMEFRHRHQQQQQQQQRRKVTPPPKRTRTGVADNPNSQRRRPPPPLSVVKRRRRRSHDLGRTDGGTDGRRARPPKLPLSCSPPQGTRGEGDGSRRGLFGGRTPPPPPPRGRGRGSTDGRRGIAKTDCELQQYGGALGDFFSEGE